MAEGIRLFKENQSSAPKEVIRKFVKDLSEVTQNIKDAREDRNEVINSDDEVQKMDEEIKGTRESRREYIKGNTVIQGYEEKLQEAIEDRRQLVADAKQDGVPRGEIDLAIRALKKDIDIGLSTEIYTNIADLVD